MCMVAGKGIHLFIPYFTSEKNGGEFIKYDIKVYIHMPRT